MKFPLVFFFLSMPTNPHPMGENKQRSLCQEATRSHCQLVKVGCDALATPLASVLHTKGSEVKLTGTHYIKCLIKFSKQSVLINSPHSVTFYGFRTVILHFQTAKV